MTNLPPITTSTIISPFPVDFGKSTLYNLPTSKDPEGLAYTTNLFSGPPYITIITSDTQLNIAPSNCATDFGTSTVIIKLTDEYPKSTAYAIDIKVNN